MKWIRPLVSAAALSILSVPVFGTFVRPAPVPIERLLQNAEADRAANPASADAHYTLARIHYMAFALSTNAVQARNPPQGTIRVVDDWMLRSLPRDFANDADFLARDEVGIRETLVSSMTREQALSRMTPEQQAKWNQAYDRHLKELAAAYFGQDRWTLTNEVALSHVAAALAGFREALRLEPKSALYALGLASLMEQFAHWKQVHQPAVLPADLAKLDQKQSSEAALGFTTAWPVGAELQIIDLPRARDAYLDAFRFAFPADSTLRTRPPIGLRSLVSYEAGNAFLRLSELESSPVASTLKNSIAEVKAGLATLRNLPRGAVTPIIFSTRTVDSIEDLLAPENHVAFDLRGYGPKERWPWLRAETALLVWDPERKGEITSAVQLFGGYTFEIFRADGYAALAALDDNRDGMLRGAELNGIRAWFDRNSDGRSEAKEVLDLNTLQIEAIDVRATSREGLHPTNSRGLVLRNGRTLPTWDWTVEPVKPLDSLATTER